jgi:hypothetical protein
MGDRERKSSPHHKDNEVWVCGMNRIKENAVLIYMRDSAIFLSLDLDAAKLPFPAQGTTIRGN